MPQGQVYWHAPVVIPINPSMHDTDTEFTMVAEQLSQLALVQLICLPPQKLHNLAKRGTQVTSAAG
jgi:hypothetical protein